MMGSWTEQMGFPVLKLLSDPFDGSATVECEQSWFLADGSQLAEDEKKTWYIPVIIGTEKGKSTGVLQTMKEKKGKLDFSACVSDSWIKVNYGQNVAMRVLYPASMTGRLA